MRSRNLTAILAAAALPSLIEGAPTGTDMTGDSGAKETLKPSLDDTANGENVPEMFAPSQHSTSQTRSSGSDTKPEGTASLTADDRPAPADPRSMTEKQLETTVTDQLKLCHKLYAEMGKPEAAKLLEKCRKAKPNDERSEEFAKVDLWVARCIELDAFNGNGTSLSAPAHATKLLENLLDLCPATVWTSKKKLIVSMIFLGEFILAAAVVGVCLAEKAALAKAEAESNGQSVENQPLMDGQSDAPPPNERQPSVPATIAGPSSGPLHSQQLSHAVQANQEGAAHQQPPMDTGPDAIELRTITASNASAAPVHRGDGQKLSPEERAHFNKIVSLDA